MMITTDRPQVHSEKAPPRSVAYPTDLITVSEAAKLLRLSRRTVERLVGRGVIPFYELPIRGALRFDRHALHDWLAQRHRSILEGR